MPRIVYVSWPAGEVAGGVKAVYQHVALLAQAGWDAVVATQDGARPWWFDSPARTMVLDDVRDDDVLVLPENSHELLQRFRASPQRKLVFCQNPFYVWRGLDGSASYADYGVERVLCVSQSTVHFLRLRMPGMALGYTPFYIDETIFRPAPARKFQIACVPRKRPTELMAVRDLFRAIAPQFVELPWIAVQSATEQQIAQALAESAVFLSLARLEAHGMTLLEAMASGCLVTGFHGTPGGNDSAHAANGLWAPEEDIVACARQLAQACTLVAEGGLAYHAMVARGRQTADAYRRQEAMRLLGDAWNLVLPR